MNTLITAAVNDELQGLKPGFKILYTGIGKENAAAALQAHLCALHPHELHGLTVLNAGTAGSVKHERGTLLCLTDVLGCRNGTIEKISIADWGAAAQLNCQPAVCFSASEFITAENRHLLNAAAHDCVDMEAFTEAGICRTAGVRFCSLKLVSDSFNMSLEQWQASLREVVAHLTDAIETLRNSNIITP